MKISSLGHAGLGVALFLTACGPSHEPPSEPPQHRFRDVAGELGLAYHGASYSAAAADFDRDGRSDLAMSGHSTLRLWRQSADGTFEDARDLGRFERGDLHGISWFDLDADGWLDLFVSHGAQRGLGRGQNRLYRNLGGEGFARTEDLPEVLADPLGRGRCSVPWDVDGDGRLDLISMNAYQEGRPQRLALAADGFLEDRAAVAGFASLDAECLAVTVPARDAAPIFLGYGGGTESGRAWRLDPSGQLRDVSEELGLPRSNPFAIARGDVDNDGDVDLYLVNGYGIPHEVSWDGETLEFRLLGVDLEQARGFHFRISEPTEVDLWVGSVRRRQGVFLGAARAHPEHVPWVLEPGDPRLDGRPVLDPDTLEPGIYLWREPNGEIALQLRADGRRVRGVSGRISGPGLELGSTMQEPASIRPRPNRLLIYENGVYVDRTEEAGVGDPYSGRDAAFFDVDNDGDLDLFVVNGGRAFDNLPDVLYRNDGDGTFTDVSREAGIMGTSEGRGSNALVFDHDGDGRLDLFVANGDGPPLGEEGPVALWHNDTPAGNWLRLDLAGGPGNPSALGAWVLATFGGKNLALERTATTGRFSTSVLPLHLGLGDAREAEILVRWPSGREETFRLEAGTTAEIRDPSFRDPSFRERTKKR